MVLQALLLTNPDLPSRSPGTTGFLLPSVRPAGKRGGTRQDAEAEATPWTGAGTGTGAYAGTDTGAYTGTGERHRRASAEPPGTRSGITLHRNPCAIH
ncbi:hypothetical protein GCM10027075_16670 [Streptomyces heilongjiangensis]